MFTWQFENSIKKNVGIYSHFLSSTDTSLFYFSYPIFKIRKMKLNHVWKSFIAFHVFYVVCFCCALILCGNREVKFMWINFLYFSHNFTYKRFYHEECFRVPNNCSFTENFKCFCSVFARFCLRIFPYITVHLIGLLNLKIVYVVFLKCFNKNTYYSRLS